MPVIPLYQRRALLKRLLEGVAAQPRSEPALCEGFDVIVVLDGSTDGSAELVESFELPVSLRSVWQPNAGPAAARNRGLRTAAGELVGSSMTTWNRLRASWPVTGTPTAEASPN